MPDFLVSAATGALSPVLRKLGALLSDEYKRYKGLHGEVESLRKDLEAMHAFLLDKSEEENPNEQDKAWMKEVRELSYDIEDSLDDFKVRVDDDSPAKPDGFIAKCKKLLQLDKTKARRRIAKEIEKLKGHVKVVSERHANYKQDTKRSKVMVDPRALAIFEDASRLVGIDQPKQEIISFLTKDDGGISSQQPKMVSIVGIGGIGKTTLAKQVYEELKNKHKFPCSAFLSVSRRPDMFKILRTILSQVNADQPYYMTKAGSIQQLIMEINKILWGKRYTFSMPHPFFG
jgi:disease resistance protein RPM1